MPGEVSPTNALVLEGEKNVEDDSPFPSSTSLPVNYQSALQLLYPWKFVYDGRLRLAIGGRGRGDFCGISTGITF